MVRTICAAGLACLAVAAAVPATGAWAGDPKVLIWTPLRNANGTYLMKMGARLPIAWEPRFGLDLGFAGTPGGLGLPPVAYMTQPPAMLWAAARMPDSLTFLGWETADLTAHFNPVAEDGGIAMVTAREWNLGAHWAARLQDSYTMTFAPSAEEVMRLQTAKSLRVSLKPTGTSFIAQTNWAEGNPGWHASLSAEQRIFAGFSLTASANDVMSANGNRSIAARFTRRW